MDVFLVDGNRIKQFEDIFSNISENICNNREYYEMCQF